MTPFDPLTAYALGVATAVCVVLYGRAQYRAGYHHARHLHNLVGGKAGDDILSNYEPSKPIFERVTSEDGSSFIART